jgi:hypothetical protein
MVKYFRISSYIRKPFLMYDFVTACAILIFLIYGENYIFFLISVRFLYTIAPARPEIDRPCIVYTWCLMHDGIA